MLGALCRLVDGHPECKPAGRSGLEAHKGCYAPFSPRARTRPPQRRAATAGPPPAPPEPSPDVPVPVPVPPAVLEHHLQAAQRIDQTLVLQTVLACCGVPPALAPGAAAAGPAMREAQRAFLTATVQPLGALLEAEVSRVLERPVRIRFHKLAAADVAARARGVHVLTQAGVDRDRALALVGWEE